MSNMENETYVSGVQTLCNVFSIQEANTVRITKTR